MIKTPFSRLVFFLVPLLLLAGFAVHSLASFLPQPATPPDTEITLILPDQQYTLFAHNLDLTQTELIIPTLESSDPNLVYDPYSGTVQSGNSPEDYVINLGEIAASLSNATLSHITLTPTLSRRPRYASNLADFNRQLNLVYRTPLSISLKDGGDFTDLVLGPNLLRSLILPKSTDVHGTLEVDKAKLLAQITPLLTPKQKEYFKPDVAYENVKTALNARFHNLSTPTVLGVDDGPTSTGEQADRYLEVDLSQQKMYFFIGGSLYKSYRISTGIDYPTPVGEYHILNKAPKAFSEIYQVWMNYWMGFKYASDVGAYLGLHEIAYALDAKGKPTYLHGYYIGDKMTGGCVAMEPKDAPEIYNLSHEGMLVRIVP